MAGKDEIRHSPGVDLVGERLVGPGVERVVAGDRDRPVQRLARRLEPLRVPAARMTSVS
jgi:hypothetical protein